MNKNESARERRAMKFMSCLSNWTLLGISTCLAVLLLYLMATRGMALSYAFLGVIAVGLFAARWLNASMKINLVLVIVSSLAALYACELVLGVADARRASFKVTRWLLFPMDATAQSAQARMKQSAEVKPTFDRRDKLEVIQDLRQQGLTAYPAVVPHNILRWVPPGEFKVLKALPIDNNTELLPLGGISNTLTVFCNESGEYVTYPSDEHGFHNPAGLWKNQQLGIVAVGDSFTHGACVPSEDNFVGVIRAHHPGTANLGMDSNGPLLMLASLKEYALRFRPKTVLWFYFEGNDLKDLEHERHSALLMSYMRGGGQQQLMNRQSEIDQKLKDYIEQARQNLGARIDWRPTVKLHHVRKALSLAYTGDAAQDSTRKSMMYFSSKVSEEEMDRFRNVLVEATSTVRNWGGTLYFIYLPEWARYGNPEFANKNRDRVLRLVKELNLPFIDLHPVFAKLPDPVGLFPFRQANHYSSEGHRLVGEEVLRVLHETDAGAAKRP